MAVACFIIGNWVYCANLGDCRAVLCRNGNAIDLSQDHKAGLQSEINRVKMNGGSVVGGRVAGRLAVARAFGDYDLKMQKDENGKVHRQDFLTVKPEIRRIDINYEVDDFILLGSDGIFDKITSQECCNFIR